MFLLTIILLLSAGALPAGAQIGPASPYYGCGKIDAATPPVVPFDAALVYLTSDSGTKTAGGNSAGEGDTVATWLSQVPTTDGDLTQGLAIYHAGGPGGQPFLSITNTEWQSRAQNSTRDYTCPLPYTAFAVFRTKSVDTTDFNAFMFIGLNCQLGYTASGFELITFDDVSLQTTIPASLSANAWHEVTAVVSNNYCALRIDGAEINHNAAAHTTFFNWERIGSSTGAANWIGDYVAALVFQTNFTAAVLGSYETNLMTKYGIPH